MHQEKITTASLTPPRFFKYWMMASLAVLIAVLVNPMNPLVARYLPPPKQPDIVGLLAMALLHGAALAWWVGHTALRQWRLAAWVAAVYVLIGAVLTQLETWLFLNLWNPVLKDEVVGVLFLNQVSLGVLVGVLTALVFWRAPGMTNHSLPLHSGSALAWRWGACAVLYFLLYVLAGYFIAIPLSGDAFQKVYGNLHIPGWSLPVQLARGAGWTAVVWMILRNFSGPSWATKLGVAMLVTVVIDAGLLVENSIFPTQLRLAHFTEIGVSMLAFGWLAAQLLLAKDTKLR